MSKELEWVRMALADRRPGFVAEKTGLSVATVTAIRDGKNDNPTIATLQKLADYLASTSTPDTASDSAKA